MAKLDSYLTQVLKLGAHSLQLQSGKNVLVRLPSGDRSASQSTSHADLHSMVREVAPDEAIAGLTASGRAEFHHLLGGRKFLVLVENGGNSLKVVVDIRGSLPTSERLVVPTTPTAKVNTVGDGPRAIGLGEPALEVERSPSGATARTRERASRVEAELDDLPSALPLDEGINSPGEVISAVTMAAMMSRSPAPTPALEPVLAQAGDASTAPTYRTVPPVHTVASGPAAIDGLLAQMRKVGASDLHLCCTMPPIVRLHGEMKPLEGQAPLTPERMAELVFEICPEKNRREFDERNDTDFAYAIPGVARFRVNLFRDRHGPGAVLRVIPFEILSADKLGLPAKVLDLCYLTKGLVVVTGPTGSGKSTTMAALIDHINEHRRDHIITIEDPVEFVHANKKCLVNQREVHVHTRSFKDALRAALREDPDIVLVGEMRDLETVAIAVETAETGHLVFGTLHTTTAPSTVDRIIDQFPSDRQSQIRQMLAESLKGVIAQTLCKKIGGGRVAAYEILIGSSAVSNLIRQGKTFQLPSLMQTSKHLGMITMNDSLLEHVKAKRIDPIEAYMKSVQKSEFKGMLEKLGIQINVQDDKE